ncbi:SDR family NAD(P)-dependent oxidoreductase [Vibrio intestinalis]|uniref:SDR family NAD(P)-dependent oxidoreductase n=1 Tax=Vibrio intestinalis TaxID=2933291 RepID=UPI0021A881A4|nr:SDR family NAD(P)-dependent oxidoreductase [Vibrio intestinalis]
MQKIAIWGAASGLGAAMVEQFHQLGFEVTAIARDPSKNLQLEQKNIPSIRCDATDKDQVNAAVSQLPQDTLHVSSMGSFMADVPVDYLGHRHLIDAMEAQQCTRLILITSLGCGDTWQYLSERAKQGFGAVVREKSLAETWLTSSSLDYTIVRPGGLKDGNVTHQAQLSQNSEVHGVISRQELARVVSTLINDPTSIGQIYHCIDPNLSY